MYKKIHVNNARAQLQGRMYKTKAVTVKAFYTPKFAKIIKHFLIMFYTFAKYIIGFSPKPCSL